MMNMKRWRKDKIIKIKNILRPIRRFFRKWTQIRIENTNLCVNDCIMCPRERLTRPRGIMSYRDFCLIVNKLGIRYKCEFYFHGFGEPLLDNHLFDKIRYVKKNYPNFNARLITSLAVADEDICRQIIDSGLDVISISCYATNREEYKRIFRRDNYQKLQDNIKTLREYAARRNSKIEIDQMGVLYSLLNYGDARHYNTARLDTVCPVVAGKRKDVLQITWDGYVIPCCFDYNATIKFGNIFQKSLKEVFKSREYGEYKEAHIKRDYSKYEICSNCEKRDTYLEEEEPPLGPDYIIRSNSAKR